MVIVLLLAVELEWLKKYPCTVRLLCLLATVACLPFPPVQVHFPLPLHIHSLHRNMWHWGKGISHWGFPCCLTLIERGLDFNGSKRNSISWLLTLLWWLCGHGFVIRIYIRSTNLGKLSCNENLPQRSDSIRVFLLSRRDVDALMMSVEIVPSSAFVSKLLRTDRFNWP